MKNIITIYKQPGETPLETIKKFKIQNPEYMETKISYAGRLDPMAEGLLLLLVGDENKNRHYYERLNKEYEFEAIFGINTDSHDLLGITSNKTPNFVPLDIQKTIVHNIGSFLGSLIQSYPVFSSARVNKKPLYYWAHQKMLNKIQIPTHHIDIYELKILNFKYLNLKYSEIYKKIRKVSGNFRQEQILSSWQNYLRKNPDFKYPLCKFRISCGSGTYIRQLVEDLGKKTKTGAFAYSIKRTKVGNYSVDNAVRLQS